MRPPVETCATLTLIFDLFNWKSSHNQLIEAQSFVARNKKSIGGVKIR